MAPPEPIKPNSIGNNSALIILWVIVIIFLIILVSVSIAAMHNYRKAVNVIIPPEVPFCEKLITGLPDVKNLQCCVISGQLTPNKYYEELNLVINPVPTYYLDVCKGFCVDGYNYIDNNCINGVGDVDFLNCVKASEPKDCYGNSQPVAISGINPYYVYSATNAICGETQKC